MMVSFYPDAKSPAVDDRRDFFDILDGIRAGRWNDQVLPVRTLYPGEGYDKAKASVPAFTASGTFSYRHLSNLLQHSGIIYLDIDRKKNPAMDIEALRGRIEADSYTLACHLSLSADGLAVAFRIPTDDHAGSFRALQQYYLQQYGVKVDSLPDPSRLRFVSYDPALYVNRQADTFEEVAEKAKTLPRLEQRPETAGGYQPRGAGNTEDILIGIATRLIAQAADGEKYVAVRNAGYLMGGYIASGFVSQARAYDALMGALRSKANVADEKVAEKAIMSGFTEGAAKPLLPDWMKHRVRQQEREGNSRELIVQNIVAVEGISAAGLSAAVDAVLDEPNPAYLTFWKFQERKSEKDNPRLTIDRVKLDEWLVAEGFRQRPAGERVDWFQVRDNVVFRVQRYTIRQHAKAYIQSLPERFDDTTRAELLEVFTTQMRALFDKEVLECLPELEDDFVRDTADVFYSFYQNCWVETTARGRVAREYAELPGLIWDSQRRPHNMVVLDDAAAKSCVFHQFTVNLTADDAERLDQLQRSLAYLMHGYKERSNARCVILMDEIGEVGKSSGGTGKGLLLQAVEQFVSVSQIDGTSFDFRDPFRYEEVADDARVVFFDEWKPQRNSFEMLFSILTGGLPINRKYAAKKTIPFEQAPKFVIATNEVVTGDDDSSNRRRIEVALAKRYSAAYTPRDEFGTDFFGTHWDEDEYIRFYNLLLMWAQRHLACERQPLLLRNESIAARGLAQDVGVSFHEFSQDVIENARLYAAEGRDHRIWAADAYLAYQQATGDKRTSAQTFNKKMEAIGLIKKKCYERDSAHRGQRYFLLPEHAEKG